MYDKMVTVLRRTRYRTLALYSRASTRSSVVTQTILVDTSLASLIMDGELWKRSPADLRHYRQDLIGQEPEKTSTNLQRSIAAHSWAHSLRCSNKYRADLRITPTVMDELTDARQVSSILLPGITLLL